MANQRFVSNIIMDGGLAHIIVTDTSTGAVTVHTPIRLSAPSRQVLRYDPHSDQPDSDQPDGPVVFQTHTFCEYACECGLWPCECEIPECGFPDCGCRS